MLLLHSTVAYILFSFSFLQNFWWMSFLCFALLSFYPIQSVPVWYCSFDRCILIFSYDFCNQSFLTFTHPIFFVFCIKVSRSQSVSICYRGKKWLTKMSFLHWKQLLMLELIWKSQLSGWERVCKWTHTNDFALLFLLYYIIYGVIE